ncbi:hypothetical protein PVAP13_1NG038508 [Panicum virgatum]|uniref:No apical meristem-associated C-terminal domain-containing protein n=1 Tax=Panicum virgatum TaxID=38727 RepID=A0A8T0WT40_PANVG|nr:hypothetical protein PVAP13_1NG038508 [Panicum virgatum]
MENLWQGMDNASQPIGEVNYTHGIDIAQPRAPEGRRKGTAKRTKNFATKEDEFLCSAWINVSKDPIVGINQPIRSYWARIKAYYDEHSKIDRSNSALQHRWADIQKDTSRFCGFYSEIERKNQSGKSENDKVKDAIQMYEGIIETTFKFIHCWYILRNEMKWNEWLASMPVGRDKGKKARSSTASSSSACLEVLQKMSMDRSAYEERVEAASNKEAKDIASRSDRKLALQEEQLQIQKAQVQIQQEMLQLQKEDREERVMSMDVDKMTPWVREYYINKQKKISAMSFRDHGSSGPSRQ